MHSGLWVSISFFLGIWTWHDLAMLCNAGVLLMLKLTMHNEHKLEIDLF